MDGAIRQLYSELSINPGSLIWQRYLKSVKPSARELLHNLAEVREGRMALKLTPDGVYYFEQC